MGVGKRLYIAFGGIILFIITLYLLVVHPVSAWTFDANPPEVNITPSCTTPCSNVLGVGFSVAVNEVRFADSGVERVIGQITSEGGTTTCLWSPPPPSGTGSTATYLGFCRITVPLAGRNYTLTVTAIDVAGNRYVASGTIGIAGGWVKMKDVDFFRIADFQNPIPATVRPFDGVSGVDSTERNLIIVQPGSFIHRGSVDLGAGFVSGRGWEAQGNFNVSSMTIANFWDYIQARKKYKLVPSSGFQANPQSYIDPNDRTLIYVVDGHLIINRLLEPVIHNINMLFVRGDVTLNTSAADGSLYYPPNPPVDDWYLVVIATGRINISPSVKRLAGVYIGQSVDFTSQQGATNNTLYIKGNIISLNSNDQTFKNRINVDLSRPSIFIDFDPNAYLSLLPYISTVNYEWRQVQ